MIASFFRFWIAFGCVGAGYFLYSMFAVPMIDGEIEKGQIEPERVKAKSSHRYEKLISDLFPEDDWIRDNCKILDAKQSVLFFKEAKQMEDGNWEVKPFTMFLNPESTLATSLNADQPGVKKDKPIILRTDEGAYIKFEDGSAPNSPSGKFSGARMPGKVIVMREESEPGANDSFEFKTTNIQVEKTQILAVNPVKFKYGPHYGSGHNLTINLADVDETKKKRKRRLPIVRNLKTVELAHLDSIILMPDDLDLSGSIESNSNEISNEPPAHSQPDHPKSALETSVAKSPVEIKCSGPFRLDFGKSQMVLFDQVHVEQLHKVGLHDHLYCDRLEVDFIIRNGGKQANPEAKDKIHFHRVTAFGSPARLLVDSKDAYAQADFIEYFIKRQIIHCRTNVELRDGSHQFIAPEMQYKLTKNNQLGTGWATGPGQIIGNPDDVKRHFKASWQSEFNIQPHEGKKAISLHGNAHIVFQGDQHFGCDELHFWLWEKRQKGANAKWDFFPAQLLGQRNVTMNAPEFAGEVNELRVFWPKPIGTIPTDPRINHQMTNGSSKRKNGENKLVSNAGTQSSLDAQTEETNEPIENRVVAKGQIAIAYLTDKNELRSFRVEKDVHVKSIDLTPLLQGKAARDMLEVHGNEIQVDSTNKKDAFKISVLGSPATIDAEGIRFVSEQLHVDQSLNQAWTDFPGQVIVSPEIKADERPFGPQPETTIRWNKRFEFDGQVIALTDDIRFEGFDYLESGDQVEYEGSTPILKARTNRRIDFSESLKKTNARLAGSPQSNPNRFSSNQVGFQNPVTQPQGRSAPSISKKPKIKISEFAMLQKAYIKATTREAINEVKSIDEIQAREINLNTITGDARAVGPGNVRSIRKGEEKQSGKQSNNLLSGLSSSSSKLSYMEIAFAGNIVGNVKERTATVNENVRCVYGPAENWETRYDPDGTTISGDEIYLNANQLTFNQWKPAGSKKALVELGAVGNTEIEGKKFRATATQLTYTEENEIILLEGLQRDTAKIWFRKNENSQWQHSEAKKFRYQRQTSEIIGSEDVLVQRFLQLEAPQLKRRQR